VPAPEPPEVELPWTTITTGDGRGADGMVQKGSSLNYDKKPSVAIAMRNGVETNHAYLRFDLAQIEDVKHLVQAAGLVLTLVGSDDQPIGSVVRVHGIKGLGMWPEGQLEWRRSFSAQGLDSDELTLLAEVEITDKSLTRDGRRSQLRITSPQFAKFILGSTTDTVTFVLSGSGPDSELLRFSSQESFTGKPPMLLVQAPKEAPRSERNRGGKSR
jgi:hypothetical protein